MPNDSGGRGAEDVVMPKVLMYPGPPMSLAIRSPAIARERNARAGSADRTPWWIVLAVLLTSLVLAAADAHGQDAPKNPFSGDPKAISEGQALYVRQGCSGCHGLKGGGGMAVALTDDNW